VLLMEGYVVVIHNVPNMNNSITTILLVDALYK
jgi:hypothetical protein